VSRLALAYLFRRPVQVIAVLGVGIGLAALLLVNAVMNGLVQADREAVRGPLSDLLLIPAISEQEGRWEAYQQALATVPSVRATAPHLVAYAVLGLQGGEVLLSRTLSSDVNGVQIVGVDPGEELQVGGFEQALASSRHHPVRNPQDPFQTDSSNPFARPGILVPDGLFRALGLRLGESIELGTLPPVLPPAGDPFLPHNARFTLVGTVRPTDHEMSMDRLWMTRTGEQGLLWNLLGDEGPDFTEALIELLPGTPPQQAKSEVLAALNAAQLPLPGGPQGGSLETWQERRSTYLEAIATERRVTGLVLFFIVIVAAFGLFATLSALVREKVRDLGVLAALGCSPLKRGTLLFTTGALGSALGALLGWSSARWLAVGDRLERLMASVGVEVFQSDLYVVDGLPTLWLSEQSLQYAVSAFLVGCLFTIIPALRASLLSPVQALRYE